MLNNKIFFFMIDLYRKQLKDHKIIREDSLIASITFWIMIGIELYWYIYWIRSISGTYFWVRLFIFPILFMLSSFYVSIMINCIFNIFIPSGWIEQNSKFYSHKPIYDNVNENILYFKFLNSIPKITIQIPVYKESFEETIVPTIENALKASYYYKSFGGSINIFINDDALMLLSNEDKQKRINFYNSYDEIFYTGRPKENRAGRFKKASNMNFGLRKIINAKYLYDYYNDNKNSNNIFYGIDFRNELDALKYISIYEGFLSGGGNKKIDIGDYILLLDSDSRVPQYILPNLIIEMEMYRDLGFMQMMTLPMQVLNNYWENTISHFTDHIYKISFVYSCATGHSAPLVGHNAILRWKAIDESSFIDDSNNIMYWSEDKVSEDFDMSLRMQSNGYFSRYIGYTDFTNKRFEEGVSLTPCEEINRLKKYAYGVNEILFYPIKEWLKKGIFSLQIKKFIICQSIPIHTKFSIIIYMASYYALATSPILAIIQYFLYRYSDYWKANVIDSLSIIFSCLILFSGLMPIANMFVVERLKYESNRSLLGIIWKELKYSFFLGIFFSGLSFHLLEAILSHMFNLNMNWSTTQKEFIKNNRLNEIGRTLKYLHRMYIFNMFWIVVIVLFWFIDIPSIQNRELMSVLPLLLSSLCHILMPILLNHN
jgi:hypothetical protein